MLFPHDLHTDKLMHDQRHKNHNQNIANQTYDKFASVIVKRLRNSGFFGLGSDLRLDGNIIWRRYLVRPWSLH
jgi:hypothetical protein